MTALDIKAAAVADMLAGESPQVVAERYKIKPATARTWKARIVATLETQHAAPIETQRETQIVPTQKATIGELVFDLLRAKLEASAAIAKAANNTEWLARQSGSELAAFGGWLDATAFAIGDRLATGRSRDDATE